MRINNGVITLDVTVDDVKKKAVVFVKMTARTGRQPVVRCRPSTVREILEENGIEVSELVSGQAIHNSLSRRLGARTLADLETTMVFSLPTPVVEEKPPEPVKAKKSTRKTTTTRTKAKAKQAVVEEVKLEQPKGEAPGQTEPVAEPATVKATTTSSPARRGRRSRAKTTAKKSEK